MDFSAEDLEELLKASLKNPTAKVQHRLIQYLQHVDIIRFLLKIITNTSDSHSKDAALVYLYQSVFKRWGSLEISQISEIFTIMIQLLEQYPNTITRDHILNIFTVIPGTSKLQFEPLENYILSFENEEQLTYKIIVASMLFDYLESNFIYAHIQLFIESIINLLEKITEAANKHELPLFSFLVKILIQKAEDANTESILEFIADRVHSQIEAFATMSYEHSIQYITLYGALMIRFPQIIPMLFPELTQLIESENIKPNVRLSILYSFIRCFSVADIFDKELKTELIGKGGLLCIELANFEDAPEYISNFVDSAKDGDCSELFPQLCEELLSNDSEESIYAGIYILSNCVATFPDDFEIYYGIFSELYKYVTEVGHKLVCAILTALDSFVPFVQIPEDDLLNPLIPFLFSDDIDSREAAASVLENFVSVNRNMGSFITNYLSNIDTSLPPDNILFHTLANAIHVTQEIPQEAIEAIIELILENLNEECFGSALQAAAEVMAKFGPPAEEVLLPYIIPSITEILDNLIEDEFEDTTLFADGLNFLAKYLSGYRFGTPLILEALKEQISFICENRFSMLSNEEYAVTIRVMAMAFCEDLRNLPSLMDTFDIASRTRNYEIMQVFAATLPNIGPLLATEDILNAIVEFLKISNEELPPEFKISYQTAANRLLQFTSGPAAAEAVLPFVMSFFSDFQPALFMNFFEMLMFCVTNGNESALEIFAAFIEQQLPNLPRQLLDPFFGGIVDLFSWDGCPEGLVQEILSYMSDNISEIPSDAFQNAACCLVRASERFDCALGDLAALAPTVAGWETEDRDVLSNIGSFILAIAVRSGEIDPRIVVVGIKQFPPTDDSEFEAMASCLLALTASPEFMPEIAAAVERIGEPEEDELEVVSQLREAVVCFK